MSAAPAFPVGALAGASARGAEITLGFATIDCNSDTDQVVATVPTGKSFLITRIIVAASSISLTTATAGFGWNTGGTDVTAAQALSAVTATTSMTVPIYTSTKIGTSGQTLKFNPGTVQGSAATATAYVLGILF